MNECTQHMNLVRLPPDNPDMLLEKFVYHVFYLSIYHLHVSSHGLIFGLVVGIIHQWLLFLVSVSVISERCNQYCTNNVIFCDYNIVNRFYDTHKYCENAHFSIRNQKMNVISIIGTCLKQLSVLLELSVKSHISASLLLSLNLHSFFYLHLYLFVHPSSLSLFIH